MGQFDEENKEPIPLSSLKQKEEGDDKISEVEIDIKKKQTDNKATLNIKNTSFIKEFVTEETKPADEIKSSSSSSSSSTPPPKTETVEDIRKRLADEEKADVSEMKVEDFDDMADFVVDLVDMGLLFAIRWYSQDISDAEYKVPEEKLKKLKKHLSRILMRVGQKFPMGILLVLGILAAYATPMRKAHENRKKVMAEKARKKIKIVNTSTKESESEDEDEDKPTYVPLRKRKGGQPK